VAQFDGGTMTQTEHWRAVYQAKIEQTETLAAKSTDSNTIQNLKLIADGYRVLLKRLRDQDPAARH
jgi:hypothetical protein